MQFIPHITPDGIFIVRFVHPRRAKRRCSRSWYLVRWTNRRLFYFSLGRDLPCAEKRAAQIHAALRR